MKRYSRGAGGKRKRLCSVLMAALLTGGACFLQGEAAQTEEESKLETRFWKEETENSETESVEPVAMETEITSGETPETDMDIPESGISETEGSGLESAKAVFLESIETETGVSDPESEEREVQQTEQPVGEFSGAEGVACLQIPERLEIVINPWEMDGKGQIYSEPFAVRNMGNVPGTVTVSFTCMVNKKEGAELRETREGLHSSGEKLIYMKVVLGNGEETLFTREGVQCQAKLQPGEEMSLWFEGEVNENADEPWKSGDIEIEGRYFWEEAVLSREEGKSSSGTEQTIVGEQVEGGIEETDG